MSDVSKLFGKEDNPVINIGMLAFKAQLEAHLTHLRQRDKTLAKHEAMKIFYESVDDIADTLVETTLGLYDIESLTVQGASDIKDPIKYFTDLYNRIETLRQSIKESFIQNQVDEIQQLISHTLYRLKNIVS